MNPVVRDKPFLFFIFAILKFSVHYFVGTFNPSLLCESSDIEPTLFPKCSFTYLQAFREESNISKITVTNSHARFGPKSHLQRS